MAGPMPAAISCDLRRFVQSENAGIIVLWAVRKPIILGEHHADGMVDRIMAVEPFVDQALLPL
jgi:hypothetical protein